jgi:hypothetical protein
LGGVSVSGWQESSLQTNPELHSVLHEAKHSDTMLVSPQAATDEVGTQRASVSPQSSWLSQGREQTPHKQLASPHSSSSVHRCSQLVSLPVPPAASDFPPQAPSRAQATTIAQATPKNRFKDTL